MSPLRRGLIVSCQARADNPLHGPVFMAAMARASEAGGAVAVRANGPEDVAAIRSAVALPVIGIHKIFAQGQQVYITPTAVAARAVADAGAEIVAFDCTFRARAGDPPAAVLRAVKKAGREAFADVSTLEEGLAAADLGVDYVATTLAGYTEATQGASEGPDLKLVEALAARLSIPVIAEGRFNTPELARSALDAGAHAVVVGTMITNPREITRSFQRAVNASLAGVVE